MTIHNSVGLQKVLNRQWKRIYANDKWKDTNMVYDHFRENVINSLKTSLRVYLRRFKKIYTILESDIIKLVIDFWIKLHQLFSFSIQHEQHTNESLNDTSWDISNLKIVICAHWKELKLIGSHICIQKVKFLRIYI